MNQTHLFRPALLLIILVTMLFPLAGCLVDEGDVPTLKNRSTDVLRTFVGGEFYDYVVFGQTTTGFTSQSFEGTLHVEYTSATIPDPLVVSGTMSVIREDSTLSLGASVFPLTRYIQQDGTGTVYVVAVRSVGGIMYRTGENTNLNNPHRINVLTSPIPASGSLSNIVYQFMQGCDPLAPCSGVVQTINDSSIVYQGDADITTNKGRFLALRIDYTNGSFLGPTAPTLFDLRGACDADQATFFGSTYVYPEVGIVFIDNSCSVQGGGGHRYTASLVNTNVPIP